VPTTIIDVVFMDDGREGPFSEAKHPRKAKNGHFSPTPVDQHYEAKHGLKKASYKSKAVLQKRRNASRNKGRKHPPKDTDEKV
jgi:hypothetical protein